MQRDAVDRLIDLQGPDAVVTALAPFLTEARRGRIEEVVASRVGAIEVAIEAPADPHNAAAVVRTCEALGVMHVHVIAAEAGALHKKRTTQGAYRWVETRHHGDLEGFLSEVRGRRRVLVGACVDAAAGLSEVPVDRPLCLLFGNEHRGLSHAARAACDQRYAIAMHGMSESLNLSVSAAISIHDVLTRYRAGRCQAGDLDDVARSRLRAHYYVRSLDARLVLATLGAR